MSTITVSKLAMALKLSEEKLILQLNEAGIDVSNKDDVVSNDQKLLLLNHLRGSHGTKSTASSAPKKLTINRRSQSELKLSGSFGRSRTVNVEVRKKRTYLQKETLIDQAKKELKEQERLEQEKIKNIEKVKPDIIATGNIGCITQISNGTKIPILHTAELIDWYTGGPKPKILSKL